MKIGMDIRELVRGRQTGIGRLLLSWLREFPAKSKDQFVLFGNQETDFDLPMLQHPIYRKVCLPERWTPVWDQWTLGRAIRAERLDLYFSPYYKVPLAMPCPYIVSLDDVISLKFEGYRGLKSRILRPVMRSIAKGSRCVVTRSEWSRRDIATDLGLSQDRIVVIPNVVDEIFSPRPINEVASRLKARWVIDAPYLLYVGTFLPHKNVRYLVQAYDRLPENLRKGYSLVLRGGGGEEDMIRREIKNSELEGRVTILGQATLDELADLYNGASLFAFPSLYEGFGLPPLEAMACGVPVVCASSTSLPEVLGEAAYWVKPQDSVALANGIEETLRNPVLFAELKERGLRRSALYPSSKSVSAILDLFKQFA